MRRLLAAPCLVTFLMCLQAAPAPATIDNADMVFDLPRLSGIVIDGAADDWRDAGLHIDLMTSPTGTAPTASDFACNVRIGWDAAGLLVIFTVRDDVFCEHAEPNEVWREDSLSVFVATKQDSKTYYQVNIGPGRDEQFDAPRIWLFDRGEWKYDDRLKIESARADTADGYVFELRLPWSNLPAEVQTGDELAVQLSVKDCDEHGGRFETYRWYPADDTHRRSDHMHRIRLSEAGGPAIRARATGTLHERDMQPMVRVVAAPDQAGAPVELRCDGKPVASAELAPADGWAAAEIVLPAPAGLDAPQPVDVLIAGQHLVTVALPNTPRLRAEAFIHVTPAAAECVFSGTDLPKVQFVRPREVEKLFGPVKLQTTYYDSEHRQVTSAERPGRYGAVTEMRLGDGRMFRRFITLYRLPKPMGWDWGNVPAKITWPKAFGVNPAAAEHQSEPIGRYMLHALSQSRRDDDSLAVLLAGLAELPDEAGGDYYSSPEMLDRQWWLGLKRTLYGWEDRWPEPLVAPTPIDAVPAPVVREGACEQAGMDPAKVAEIDALLNEWANQTNEPFAVCLVRHGVAFHHKAYGTFPDGAAMTLQTPTWMASMTKLMGGVAMTIVLDSGRLDLTAPASDYLPPLAQTPTEPVITLRHLYTHTADLDWHWGAERSDMEERIAVLLPHLNVGRQWRYNGTDMNLATKALEAATGETLPAFFNNHLLRPLGCTHTFLPDAGGGSRSIAMDMARLGQMLLNRGAYGEMRFFRPEAMQLLLPRPVDDLIGPTSDQPYGLGTSWYDGEGWGDGAFGHGAASGALFRVIPAHDMVVVMTRNSEASNFDQWRVKFTSAVLAAIKD